MSIAAYNMAWASFVLVDGSRDRIATPRGPLHDIRCIVHIPDRRISPVHTQTSGSGDSLAFASESARSILASRVDPPYCEEPADDCSPAERGLSVGRTWIVWRVKCAHDPRGMHRLRLRPVPVPVPGLR
jgi:hypothetical protein